MGYTTEFEGIVKVTPPLSLEECNYLNMFSNSRRMDRKAGPYYVGDDENEVFNVNRPPKGQPGLWCQWVPTEDGTGIEWDGNEKFYEAEKWMQYIIDHFFGADPIAKRMHPDIGEFLQKHSFSGIIEASGEERDDVWRIRIAEDGQQVIVDQGKANIDVANSVKVKRLK